MGLDPSKMAPARRLCADLSRLLCAIVEGRRKPDEVARELQKLSDFAAGIAPKKAAVAAVDTKDIEDRIFVYWRETAGKSQAKFTIQRREKVRSRLRAGYSEAAIRRAIDFVCSDPWHTGGNSDGKVYVDLELICRNDTKLEQYIERAGEVGAAPSVTTTPEDSGKQEALEAAKREAARALKAGDVDAYNRAQSTIKNFKR